MGVFRKARAKTFPLPNAVPCVLLLLLVLQLLLLVGQGEGVSVAAFEHHKVRMCQWLYEEEEPPQQLCALLWPTAVQTVNPATLMHLDTAFINVTAEISAFELSVTVNGVMYHLNQTLEAEFWTRVCVGVLPAHTTPTLSTATPADPSPATNPFHHTTTTPTSPVTTTLDDQFFSTPAQPSPEPPFVVWVAVGDHLLNVTEIQNFSLSSVPRKLCFGDHRDQDRMSFTGLVTAMSTDITKTPHITVNCREADLGRDELISDWRGVSNVPFIELEEEQVCSRHVHDITLHTVHGYSGLRKLCGSLGGRLPRVEEAATEVDDYRCVTEDGFVSWLHDDDVNMEGVWSQCPALLVNNTAGQRLCVEDLPCSRCRVPSVLRYYLYGPVEDFDREYFLRMLPNGRFYFEGRYTSNISRRDNEWTLWSRLHHRWWRLGQDSWPLGRRLWYSPHLNATLTFSSCNAIQFPANDGTCLLRSQRCNGQQDHPDDSDEVGCRDRLVYKNPDYDAKIKPTGASDTVNISYTVYLINIDKISAAQDVANMELAVGLEWRDQRLRFVDIRDRMSFFPCEEIWTPVLYLFSGHSWGPEANVSRVMKFCYVKRRHSMKMEVNVTDPYLGKVTPEKSEGVQITMEIKMHVSSTCQLKLSRYPFGRYTCNTTIMLFDKGCSWVESSDALSYERDPDLLDYHLDNQTVVPEGRKLTLTLYLSGQADYHLLGSFSPSGLMFLICYSTLYYPIGNFNERLMASLTSLLVLVALFSQTTATNVKTPYYKLLDVWYVVLVALCFLVVIANSLVHMLHNIGGDARMVTADDDDDDDNDDIGKKFRVPKRAVRCNTAFRFFLLAVFFLLTVIYGLIGSEYL